MSSKTLHDLYEIQQYVFDACGYHYTQPVMELESAEYGACTFKLNGSHVIYRLAKITPTKTGQFVTLWKREDKDPIQPFATNDQFDLVIISCRHNNRMGCFIFPKNALLSNGVLSTNSKGGKRAIRVYPPWDETTSKQAQRSQQWQLAYFLEISLNEPIDVTIAKKLLGSA